MNWHALVSPQHLVPVNTPYGLTSELRIGKASINRFELWLDKNLAGGKKKKTVCWWGGQEGMPIEGSMVEQFPDPHSLQEPRSEKFCRLCGLQAFGYN